MKFISRGLSRLFLLLLFGVVLLYIVGQTRWAAGYLSRWLTDHSAYHLSFSKLTHSWDKPNLIVLEDVLLTRGQGNEQQILAAKQAELSLDWQNIETLKQFKHITLRNGSLNVRSQMGLGVQADVLQLSNMALQANYGGADLNAWQVNGGISPWHPQADAPLGTKSKFQFSAAKLTLNGINAEQVFIEGASNNKQLQLTNFGADIAQGALTGSASRLDDGRWLIEQLQLSHTRLQIMKSLQAGWLAFARLPALVIKDAQVIDASLEGPHWAINGLSFSLKNVAFNQGVWHSENGQMSANAQDIISGSLHLQEPVINLALLPSQITINEFSARWAQGFLHASGRWLANDKSLQLSDVMLTDIDYLLAEDGPKWWQQPLPDWLSQVHIGKLIADRNQLMSTLPSFPFQARLLSAAGNALLLVKNQQWGLWQGGLTLNSEQTSLKKVDMRHFSLALRADDNYIDIYDASAMMTNGLLAAKMRIAQSPERPFSLALNGRAVPIDILSHWGWQPEPLQGDGNFQFDIQGAFSSGQPVSNTLHGVLRARDLQGKTLEQQKP